MRYPHRATVTRTGDAAGATDAAGNWVPDPEGAWYAGPVDIQDEGQGRPKELTGEAATQANAHVYFPAHVDVGELSPEDTMVLEWEPHLGGAGRTSTAEVVRVVVLDNKAFVRYA